MPRALFVICCFLIAQSAIASQPFIYSVPAGAYRLSPSDIAEIQRLASGRRDIRKPISNIQILATDYAEVEGGNPQKDGDRYTLFAVHKKRGKWTIRDVRQTVAQFVERQ